MNRVLIVGLPLAFLGFGCNQADRDNVEHDATKLAHSAGDAVGNMTINGKVNMVLSWRKDLDISGLKIDTDGGTVSLSGHLPTEEQHKVVLDLAKGLKGVDKVQDNVSVP